MLRLAAKFGMGRSIVCRRGGRPLLLPLGRVKARPAAEGVMSVLLGAIADDFTGATDLCNTLVRRGMRTVQLIDVPKAGTAVPEAEAVVIALKSRTIPAADAGRMCLHALDWLPAAGGREVLFKYCSPFGSTASGNSCPV